MIVSSLQDSVGIQDELFPLRALIAAQNCLGFLALAMLFTQDFLALLNSFVSQLSIFQFRLSVFQSKSSIISDAFVKSAFEYFQIALFTVFDGFFMHLVILNDIPLWSELMSGGITEQFSTKPLFDTRARSIKVALPLVATRVGSCTT